MTAIQLSPATEQLLTQLRDQYHQAIDYVVAPTQSGVIKDTATQQVPQVDGSIRIELSDATAVDYALSHELWHLLLKKQEYPQLTQQTGTVQPKLAEQFLAFGSSLYDCALHVVIAQKQREAGQITEKVQAAYLAGVDEVLRQQQGKTAPAVRLYCVLQELDALTFLAGETVPQLAEWQQLDPKTWLLAKSLYKILTQKALTSPFAFRRSVVALLRQFDVVLDQLGLMAFKLNQALVLTPILSERQLRLAVNQTYQIQHTDNLLGLKHQQLAYVGLGKSDEQAAFVLDVAAKTATPEYFQQRYQMPLAQFLQQQQVTYFKR